MPGRSGILHFCLENDNAVTGVQVTIKVVAVTITENWEEREVQKFRVADKDEPYLKISEEKPSENKKVFR